MKKYLCVALTLLFVAVLVSCNMMSDDISIWRDGIEAEDIAESLKSSLTAKDGWDEVENDYVSRMNFGDGYDVIISSVDDWHIVTSEHPEINADMIGVFHVNNPDNREAVIDNIRDYVQAQKLRLSEVFGNYVASEQPKIDNAQVKVCGNYVLITFLDADRTVATQKNFEDILKK